MPDRAILPLLRDVVAACDALVAASAVRTGLSRSDRRALEVVVGSPGLTAGDLATRIALTTGAATGVLDRLESQGLVERLSIAQDRRLRIVKPTARGCDLDHATWEPVGDVLDQVMAAYRSEEIGVVVGFLRAASAAVGGLRERVDG